MSESVRRTMFAAVACAVLLPASADDAGDADERATRMRAQCEAGGGCVLVTRRALVEVLQHVREATLQEALEQCGKRI